jgi:hypothetical protein
LEAERPEGVTTPFGTPNILGVTRLTDYAARGRAACGDLRRVWTLSGGEQAPQSPEELLAARPWLVAGTLRAGPDALCLHDSRGASLRTIVLDAAGAWPLVGSHVLAVSWAMPPGTPATLELRTLCALSQPSEPLGGALRAEAALFCRVRSVSQPLCVRGQAPFAIAVRPALFHSDAHCDAMLTQRCRAQEVVRCFDGLLEFVYLDGAALATRPLLASAAGARACIALTGLKRKRLFPSDPQRATRVLVASSAVPGGECASHHSSDGSDGGTAPCGCAPCVAGMTACMHAEVLGCAPAYHGAALSLRAVGGGGAPTEVTLLLAPHPCYAGGAAELAGVRPGARLLLLHAARLGPALLAVTARTALCVTALSPLAAPLAAPPHTTGALALRIGRASLAHAAHLCALHEDVRAKLAPLGGAEALLDALAAAAAAALGQPAPGGGQAALRAASARGDLFEELLKPCASLARMLSADAEAAAEAGAVHGLRLPSLSSLRAAAEGAWRAGARMAARDSSAGWPGDALDEGGLARLVAPLQALLGACAPGGQPAALLAWARRSADGGPGWLLSDATGSVEALPEPCDALADCCAPPPWLATDGQCVMLARARVVAEGAQGGAAPLRLYIAFAPAHAQRVPAADLPSRAPPPQRAAAPDPWREAAALGVRAALRSSAKQLCVRALVVGERIRSVPHLMGPDAATATAQGSRLRLRDLAGRDCVDLYLDSHRRQLPPGIARGAVLLIRGAARSVGASGTTYLKAWDATTFSALSGPQEHWAGPLPPPPPAEARLERRVSVAQLYGPQEGPPAGCVRLRVRVAGLIRLTLRWSCTHCGCDVAEVRAALTAAHARRCASPPPFSARASAARLPTSPLPPRPPAPPPSAPRLRSRGACSPAPPAAFPTARGRPAARRCAAR